MSNIIPLFAHNRLSGIPGERMFKRHAQMCNYTGYDMFLEALPWFHRKRYLKFKLSWRADKAEFFMKGRLL